jgi:hypothetical protein
MLRQATGIGEHGMRRTDSVAHSGDHGVGALREPGGPGNVPVVRGKRDDIHTRRGRPGHQQPHPELPRLRPAAGVSQAVDRTAQHRIKTPHTTLVDQNPIAAAQCPPRASARSPPDPGGSAELPGLSRDSAVALVDGFGQWAGSGEA